MIKILIYDTDSSHHNTVKATVEHSASVDVTFHRIYSGFQGNYEGVILDYCLANSIDIVIIPYSGITTDAYNISREGIAVVKPFYTTFGSIEGFTGAIQVSGGINEATNPPGGNTVVGLDFYGEVDNLTGSARIAPSYVAGKVAGLIANLLDAEYSIYEARQILRQNSSEFENWTTNNGFGKLPDAISVPDPLLTLSPVNVKVLSVNPSSLNPGLGVLQFNAEGNSFNFDDGNGGINATSNPFIIEGEDKVYNIDFSTEYGGTYTALEFELGDYVPKAIPKKVEVFYFDNSSSNRRFRIGNTSATEYIPSEREGDRVEYRVFDNSDVLQHQGFGSWNSPVVLFEPINNPDFSLQNSGGATYKFQFRFVNEYGEGDWSDIVSIIDDENDRSEAFDSTAEPLPDPDPDPDPEEPEIFPENKLSLKNLTLRNTEVFLNGDILFEVLNEKQTVDLDLENFKSLAIKKRT